MPTHFTVPDAYHTYSTSEIDNSHSHRASTPYAGGIEILDFIRKLVYVCILRPMTQNMQKQLAIINDE